MTPVMWKEGGKFYILRDPTPQEKMPKNSEITESEARTTLANALRQKRLLETSVAQAMSRLETNGVMWSDTESRDEFAQNFLKSVQDMLPRLRRFGPPRRNRG